MADPNELDVDDPATTVNTTDGSDPVTLADVRAAATRLLGVAVRTPLLPFGPLEQRPGAPRVWLKPESLQPIGAFKIRGAFNALSQLDPDQRAAGVVTHSSGNHAQGVSRAARSLGIHAVIVMPRDAPAIKVERVRADGAEIDFVGPEDEERIARADALASQRGLVLVPSYDDARIVAGQGTVGLEIVEQIAELSTAAHRALTVLAPIGGGGLSSGICVSVKALRPDAVVVGVEPELAADAAESMARGEIVRWPPEQTSRTIADGMRSSALGVIPFALLRRHLNGVVTVGEDEIKVAMATAASTARLVVEPSGATTIAAWSRYGARIARDGDVVIVVSGGNVDPDRYRALVAEGTSLA